MMRNVIAHYVLGDMSLFYHRGRDRKGNDCTGMLLIPSGMEDQLCRNKDYDIEPLVQMKIIGDDYPFNYSQGRTMRGSQTGMRLVYEGQTVEKDSDSCGLRIITKLADSRGIRCSHILSWREGDRAVRICCQVENGTGQDISMEMLTSFTLGGMTPFTEGTAAETLYLHQIRSTWANEGRLVSRPVEEYQLEPSWKPSGANGIRFGQVGSMPDREYFPFIGVEDRRNQVCWGAQLSIGSSWQLEAYRKDDALSISGGIADREKGHWVKRLSDGEMFRTPEAVVSSAVGDIDVLCQRITKTMENHMGVNCPEGLLEDALEDVSGGLSEESLPVLFNEFCTTWGNPEEAQIRRIVDLLAGRGAAYFVIDAGWYKKHEGEDDKWSIEHGDWQCSSRLFPSGIHKLVEYIHQKGMKAGIWFEPENCGRNSEIFRKTELLAQRDGYPITAGNRRFLDMRKPEVWEYLDDRMLRFLRDNGFDYVKIDYNANLGIGPDGGDSLGSALYDSVMATRQYFRHLKEEIPGLLIENCSAGGHRLTGAFLELTDMSSFSDAHECSNIPLVAANMHRMIPVRQSQIWAVLHPEFSDAMLYNKLTAALLGRMCLSGDIEGLSAEQWEIVEEAIDFYRQAAPVIAKGTSRIRCHTGLSYKEPRGSQTVLRTWRDRMLLVVHTFADGPESLEVEAEPGAPEGLEIQRICSRSGITAEIKGNKIKVGGLRDFDGIGILLKRSAAR